MKFVEFFSFFSHARGVTTVSVCGISHWMCHAKTTTIKINEKKSWQSVMLSPRVSVSEWVLSSIFNHFTTKIVGKNKSKIYEERNARARTHAHAKQNMKENKRKHTEKWLNMTKERTLNRSRSVVVVGAFFRSFLLCLCWFTSRAFKRLLLF